MTKAGRPKKAADINGRRLRDSIIEYYGSIAAAAEYLGKSRTWLSLCLKNEAINREDLDRLCQDMDQAPAFYYLAGGGIMIKDKGAKAARIPKYAENELYKTIAPGAVGWNYYDNLLRLGFAAFQIPEEKAALIIDDTEKIGLLNDLQTVFEKHAARIHTEQLTDYQKYRLRQEYRNRWRPDLD